MQAVIKNNEIAENGQSAWGAVVAMAMCAAILIASEFLPMSLLTPMASDLHITEGTAGQSISISGLFAMVTSVFISAIIGNTDRRKAILFFTSLMIVSGLIVVLAPNAAILMGGRAFLGVAVGGFWSISAAAIMRIVPKDSVPKALALLNGGNALASTLAAPLGSFLGSIIGWRGAFFCLIPLAVIALFWLWKSLPSLPSQQPRRPATEAFKLLKTPKVAFGMTAIALLFMGQFVLFTYLRPFLEIATKVDTDTLSIMLLGIGVAGFIGTYIIGGLLKTRLYSVIIPIPTIMAIIALALIVFSESTIPTGLLLLGWGLTATAAPVGWWTWISKTLPDDAEAGGGLMVAIIQMAIMFGAAGGGIIYDHYGYTTTFIVSAMILSASSIMGIVTLYSQSRISLQSQIIV